MSDVAINLVAYYRALEDRIRDNELKIANIEGRLQEKERKK